VSKTNKAPRAGTPSRGPLASPGYQVWTMGLAWARAVAKALAPVQLTHTQFFVLGAARWLAKESGRAPNQRDVTRFASLDPMTTTQVVRALEQRGLLARKDDPDDSRAWLLALTAAGERAFQEAIPLVRRVDASFFGAGAASIAASFAQLPRE
jgi:DNA-binding MarR family transcriptional regulator